MSQICKGFILRRITEDGAVYATDKRGTPTKKITEAMLWTKEKQIPGYITLPASKAFADLFSNHNKCAQLLRRISEGDKVALKKAEEVSDEAAMWLQYIGDRTRWNSANWAHRTNSMEVALPVVHNRE